MRVIPELETTGALRIFEDCHCFISGLQWFNINYLLT